MIDQTPQVPPRPSFGLTVEEMGRLTEIVGRLSQAELPLPEVLLGMADDMPSRALAQSLRFVGKAVSEGVSIEEAIDRAQASTGTAASGILRTILRRHPCRDFISNPQISAGSCGIDPHFLAQIDLSHPPDICLLVSVRHRHVGRFRANGSNFPRLWFEPARYHPSCGRDCRFNQQTRLGGCDHAPNTCNRFAFIGFKLDQWLDSPMA